MRHQAQRPRLLVHLVLVTAEKSGRLSECGAVVERVLEDPHVLFGPWFTGVSVHCVIRSNTPKSTIKRAPWFQQEERWLSPSGQQAFRRARTTSPSTAASGLSVAFINKPGCP